MTPLVKVNWDVLNEYIENSLIIANKHPEYDIWILNYSPKAQSKKFWDEYTMSCRGMIIDAEGNILARPFQKFKNYQEHDPKEIDLTKPYVIYEKMDGCFLGNTKLNLWDGGTITIREVVKKKKNVKLIGMDEHGKIVPSYVTNWFDNGVKINWMLLTVDCLSSKGVGCRNGNHIPITPNHSIFLNGEFQPAMNAKVDDIITNYYNCIDDFGLHYIKSSLLGDGSVVKVHDNYRYQESHTNKCFINTIKKSISNILIKDKDTISGFGSKITQLTTKTYDILEQIRNEWYDDNGIKHIPKNIDWIDNFCIAKWYMDDGSLIHTNKQTDRAHFATNSFSENDCQRLCDKLIEFYGVDAIKYQSKGWNIRINSGYNNEIDVFWNAIHKYIPKELNYKLPLKYKDKNKRDWGVCYEIKKSVDVKILNIDYNLDIENSNYFNSGRKGFDIQTSTSNYFIKGMLVHNSLIIVFYYAPRMEWIVTSRGSFISEQSIEARKMIGTKTEKLNKSCTYLFEIIYPENRIVVDYGDRRELVLLSKIQTFIGHELEHVDLVENYSDLFSVVKVFDFKDIKNMKDLQALEEVENKEGYVFRHEDFRFKWKFSEYVRLHGILTNVSNLTVWEHLKNGYEFDELLDRVPDEFYNWLQRTAGKLQSEYNEIERQALQEFVRIYHINEITERPLFAEQAKLTEYRSILFKLYDKRAYAEIIWKQIRPMYSKPFSRNKISYLENN